MDFQAYPDGQTTNIINVSGLLTVEGVSYNITSGARAIYAGKDINITNGANIESIDTESTVIYAENNLNISGNGTSVNVEDAYYCVLLSINGVTINDGAQVTGSSTNGH